MKKHFLDQMDEDTKAWRAAALFDLYNGPSGVEGPEGYTYARALKELNAWWSQNGHDVWFDTQSEYVLDSDPTQNLDEEDEEGSYSVLEDTLYFDSSAARKIVFGELVTDGGMNNNPKRGMRRNYDPDTDPYSEGMAATLWADQWASHVDEHRCTRLSGVEITSVMPPVPAKAYELATELMVKISAANGGKSITDLLEEAAQADGVTPDAAYMRSFGSDLALMALGHGVSWFDDHATFPLKVPSFEAYELREIADETCGLPHAARAQPRRRR